MIISSARADYGTNLALFFLFFIDQVKLKCYYMRWADQFAGKLFHQNPTFTKHISFLCRHGINSVLAPICLPMRGIQSGLSLPSGLNE